ncbi:hypothetical protein CH330_05445 [candidate division WOR-3 bacterium JGI_Cruoil_03_51_56]|uniref:Segregation and condensation protein A n=1 Tax=candidate division WOR-3 bacterium JGI_Cruoil_03_51_56 TaxID=1973747 RepID=A0A235BTH7_UNCW3|nr:MAG: hypothetical protein CH330_05445 [candidate division WOR-3 bacterium JGI_Cruoil_03_51_56]
MFEGPIELLLYLVRKNELDVFDVPIGRLTDDYLDFVRSTIRLDLVSAADFLVLAGILVRLKMRRLLPSHKAEELETPTTTLEQILDEFRKYQRAAKVLCEREMERRRVFPRPGTAPRSWPSGQLDLSILTDAFRHLIRMRKPDNVVRLVPRKIHFQEKLEQLRQFIRTRGTVRFNEALSSNSIAELIVMFIALLELVRLGEVCISQRKQFDPITLELRDQTDKLKI